MSSGFSAGFAARWGWIMAGGCSEKRIIMINWILRTYKTPRTAWYKGGRDGNRCGTEWRCGGEMQVCRGWLVGWLQDSQQALKSEMQSGEGFCDLLGFIWKEGSVHIYAVKSADDIKDSAVVVFFFLCGCIHALLSSSDSKYSEPHVKLLCEIRNFWHLLTSYTIQLPNSWRQERG